MAGADALTKTVSVIQDLTGTKEPEEVEWDESEEPWVDEPWDDDIDMDVDYDAEEEPEIEVVEVDFNTHVEPEEMGLY